MTLRARITEEQFEALEDPIKAEYKKHGDAYIIDVTPVEGWGLEDVAGLKSSLAKERQNAAKADDLKTHFGELDLDEVLKTYEQFKDTEGWSDEETVNKRIEALKLQLETKHAGEITQSKAENEQMMREISRLLIDSEVAKATERREENETSGHFDLLIEPVRAKTKIVKGEDGKFRAIAIDSSGTPRITSASGSTEPMGVKELLAEMKSNSAYQPAFDGKKSTGSGDVGSVKRTTTSTSNIDQAMPPADRIAAFRRQQTAGK